MEVQSETIKDPFNIDASKLSAAGQTWAEEKIAEFKAKGFSGARIDKYVLGMEDELKGDYGGKFPHDPETEVVSDVFTEEDKMEDADRGERKASIVYAIIGIK